MGGRGGGVCYCPCWVPLRLQREQGGGCNWQSLREALERQCHSDKPRPAWWGRQRQRCAACTRAAVPIMHFGCLFTCREDSVELVQEETAHFRRRRKTSGETREKKKQPTRMRGRGKGDERRSRTSGTRWAGCRTPSPALSPPSRRRCRRPAPLTCLRTTILCNYDDSCLRFTGPFYLRRVSERGARHGMLMRVQFEINGIARRLRSSTRANTRYTQVTMQSKRKGSGG